MKSNKIFRPWTLKQWRHQEAAYTIIIIMYLWVCLFLAILYPSTEQQSSHPTRISRKKENMLIFLFFLQLFGFFFHVVIIMMEIIISEIFWAISAILCQQLNTQSQYLWIVFAANPIMFEIYGLDAAVYPFSGRRRVVRAFGFILASSKTPKSRKKLLGHERASK